MQDLGAFDAQNIAEELSVSQFEIGQVRFNVQKLPAMAAWALMEQIRRELGRTSAEVVALGNTAASNDDEEEATGLTWGTVIQMVLSLEPVFVDGVRKKLFERVEFQRDDTARTPQKLAAAEDMAFEDVEPLAVYEVLLRCLVVNFSPSLRALGSRFGVLGRTSIPSSPSG